MNWKLYNDLSVKRDETVVTLSPVYWALLDIFQQIKPAAPPRPKTEPVGPLRPQIDFPTPPVLPHDSPGIPSPSLGIASHAGALTSSNSTHNGAINKSCSNSVVCRCIVGSQAWQEQAAGKQQQ